MTRDELGFQTTSETSRAAAIDAARTSTSTRSRIYRALLAAGPGTAEEIAERIDSRYDTVKARLHELRELNLAETVGRRETRTGSLAARWVAIAHENAGEILRRPRKARRGRAARYLDGLTKALGFSELALQLCLKHQASTVESEREVTLKMALILLNETLHDTIDGAR